jgi:glycosyltransferase involved in cell wall biosynthesis
MPAERFALIENGYDEESFAGVDTSDRSPLNPGMLTLLHSGIVYPEERDPTELMRGLAILQSEGAIAPGTFRVRFRAPVHGELIAKLAREAGVEPLVEILPSIPYRQAIQEMMRADALLLLQAANCNQQIPAKAYEYFRTGRPIVALTDPAGDTAETMRRAGCANVAPLDDARAIADLLRRWVRGRDHDVLNMPSPHAIDAHSRRSRTAELARMLDSVA